MRSNSSNIRATSSGFLLRKIAKSTNFFMSFSYGWRKNRGLAAPMYQRMAMNVKTPMMPKRSFCLSFSSWFSRFIRFAQGSLAGVTFVTFRFGRVTFWVIFLFSRYRSFRIYFIITNYYSSVYRYLYSFFINRYLYLLTYLIGIYTHIGIFTHVPIEKCHIGIYTGVWLYYSTKVLIAPGTYWYIRELFYSSTLRGRGRVNNHLYKLGLGIMGLCTCQSF